MPAPLLAIAVAMNATPGSWGLIAAAYMSYRKRNGKTCTHRTREILRSLKPGCVDPRVIALDEDHEYDAKCILRQNLSEDEEVKWLVGGDTTSAIFDIVVTMLVEWTWYLCQSTGLCLGVVDGPEGQLKAVAMLIPPGTMNRATFLKSEKRSTWGQTMEKMDKMMKTRIDSMTSNLQGLSPVQHITTTRSLRQLCADRGLNNTGTKKQLKERAKAAFGWTDEQLKFQLDAWMKEHPDKAASVGSVLTNALSSVTAAGPSSAQQQATNALKMERARFVEHLCISKGLSASGSRSILEVRLKAAFGWDDESLDAELAQVADELQEKDTVDEEKLSWQHQDQAQGGIQNVPPTDGPNFTNSTPAPPTLILDSFPQGPANTSKGSVTPTTITPASDDCEDDYSEDDTTSAPDFAHSWQNGGMLQTLCLLCTCNGLGCDGDRDELTARLQAAYGWDEARIQLELSKLESVAKASSMSSISSSKQQGGGGIEALLMSPMSHRKGSHCSILPPSIAQRLDRYGDALQSLHQESLSSPHFFVTRFAMDTDSEGYLSASNVLVEAIAMLGDSRLASVYWHQSTGSISQTKLKSVLKDFAFEQGAQKTLCALSGKQTVDDHNVQIIGLVRKPRLPVVKASDEFLELFDNEPLSPAPIPLDPDNHNQST